MSDKINFSRYFFGNHVLIVRQMAVKEQLRRDAAKQILIPSLQSRELVIDLF